MFKPTGQAGATPAQSALLKTKKREYATAFWVAVLTAACIFLPFVIIDKGFFLYCGDYNSQQIPFYVYVHNAIKSGAINYSWQSDLGTSFINAYSYYMATSPFMVLLLPFPTSWVPYLMAPLMALKFGIANVGAFGFLRRYSLGQSYALFGALLYTFSGYAVYNIFFNSGFLEAIAFFPFMLWALDDYFETGRKGFFAFSVAINLFNNYFFFIGQALFIAVYYFVRLFAGAYPKNLKKFAGFAFQAVLGCFMGCLPTFPALINLLQNPRVFNGLSGFGLLLHGSVQQYMAIFFSAFFPPDPPYLANLFTNGSIRWTSLSAYLPLVSFVGVATFLLAKRGQKSWLKNMLYVSFIMALVPVLNNAFYALNVNYYARWFNMPILLMALATMEVVQNPAYDLKKGFYFTAKIFAVYLLFGLIPLKLESGKWQLGLAGSPAKFWLTFFTAVLGLLLLYLLLANRQKWGNLLFMRRLITCTMVFILLYSVIHISLGKFPQWERDGDFKTMRYDPVFSSGTVNALLYYDDTFYRIDTYEGGDNLGLHWNLPCIQFFHSVVTPSIMDFYPSVGVTRNVRSTPPISNYALRGLLGVKYLFVPVGKVATLQDNGSLSGYTSVLQLEDYQIFENNNYLPMGFAYDFYMTEEDFASVITSQAANVLVRAVVLSEEQIELYGQDMQALPPAQLYDLSYTSFEQDCAARRRAGVYNFEADTNGFTAQINLSTPHLVFFSVPYDTGFTAYINGVETKIENVSNGMSAVWCPAGNCEIEFKYETPGLRLSAVCTVLAFIVLFIYMAYPHLQKRKKTKPAEQEMQNDN